MIAFLEIRSPMKLEKIVRQYFSQHDTWNDIVEAEKEILELYTTEQEQESEIIAYEITDNGQVCGLIQYSYDKAGFLKKERLVINLLSLITDSLDTVQKIHQALIQKHKLSGRLIHTISLTEEDMPIHRFLKENGFEEHRNSRKHPKYGFQAGSLYFIKEVGSD